MAEVLPFWSRRSRSLILPGGHQFLARVTQLFERKFSAYTPGLDSVLRQKDAQQRGDDYRPRRQAPQSLIPIAEHSG